GLRLTALSRRFQGKTLAPQGRHEPERGVTVAHATLPREVSTDAAKSKKNGSIGDRVSQARHESLRETAGVITGEWVPSLRWSIRLTPRGTFCSRRIMIETARRPPDDGASPPTTARECA